MAEKTLVWEKWSYKQWYCIKTKVFGWEKANLLQIKWNTMILYQKPTCLAEKTLVWHKLSEMQWYYVKTDVFSWENASLRKNK